MANYLVTGGAGFIGSHISEALVKRGHRVRVVDNFVTGYQHNLRDGVEFVEGDLADPAVAARAVQGMDYVVHQAAIPSVPRSVDKPAESHRANVDATLNLLIASRDAGVKRLVFAGSSSVYGDTEVLPKTETMPTNPLSPYALQKLMGEMYGQMFTRLYGFETVTTRYFNVFGPRQDPSSPYSGVISLFIKALHERHDAGDLRRRRADARLHLRDQRRRRRDSLGGDAGRRRAGVQRRHQRPHLAQPTARDAEEDLRLERHADLQGRRAAATCATRRRTSRKRRELLGYQPIVGLEEGLRETVKWFKSTT